VNAEELNPTTPNDGFPARPAFLPSGTPNAYTPTVNFNLFRSKELIMVTQMMEVAAAGYALLYLLLGGGLGGAILVFIIAKLLGR
jgi:hypothetical protein